MKIAQMKNAAQIHISYNWKIRSHLFCFIINFERIFLKQTYKNIIISKKYIQLSMLIVFGII